MDDLGNVEKCVEPPPLFLSMHIEDCLDKAKWGMKEHLNLLKKQGLPIPPKNSNPKIVIQNAQETVVV